ncbi:MAG TPA: hypothetical protein VHG28_16390 [Longimicrobiaceae bacterium]|nr:hypothetical protein [Longimicrobiaceae bacterium]
MHFTFRGFVAHDSTRTTVRSLLLVLALLPMLGAALLLMGTLGRSMEEPVLAGFLAAMVVWLVVLLRSVVVFGEWTLAPGGVEMRWRRFPGRWKERTVA